METQTQISLADLRGTSIEQTVIDTSIVISLVMFTIRVFLKEARGVISDFFQMLEVFIRWWILIRNASCRTLNTSPAP
jgi:hypothetical protein